MLSIYHLLLSSDGKAIFSFSGVLEQFNNNKIINISISWVPLLEFMFIKLSAYGLLFYSDGNTVFRFSRFL